MAEIFPSKQLPSFAESYLHYMYTVKGKSANTVKEYFYDLRLFFRYIYARENRLNMDDDIDVSNFDLQLLNRITLFDLFEYMAYLRSERHLESAGRARKTASIKSFFKYCYFTAKILDNNVAAELDSPKIPKKLPRYLELDESKKLLSSVPESGCKFSVRDYCILTLFLNCGLRLSELASINLKDIREDTLYVVGKGNKERTIYLNASCLEAINSYLAVRPHDNVKDREALFLSGRSQRISVKTIQYIVKKYLKAAGLDENKYSVHKLRHTAATLMYQHGHVNIRELQMILGHESISTTEIYTHINSEALRSAVNSNPLASFSVDFPEIDDDEQINE